MLDDIISGGIIGGVCGLIVFVINKLRVRNKPSASLNTHPSYAVSMAILGRGGFMNDRLFPLPDNAIGIGTDPSRCAVVYPLNVSCVAPLHCQIAPHNEGWLLIDFSETGTWHNGKKLNRGQPINLSDGDEFYIGTQENAFVFKAMMT